MGSGPVWTRLRLLHLALFIWWMAVIAVCIRVARHPGSHSAFHGVWVAGGTWLRQGRLYGPDTGFLYTPLIAGLHAPFALFPEAVSEVIWRLFIGVAFPAALWFNSRALFQFSTDQFAGLLLLALPLTLNTLNNGQSNIVLIILFLLAAGAATRSRWLLCSACAAFAIYWKIYPISFALLLIILFPEKLSLRMLLCLLALFAVSLLLQRPSYVFDEYGNWITNLMSDQRRELEYYGKNRDFYLLLRILGVPISLVGWTILQLLGALGAAAICLAARSRRLPTADLVFGAMCLAIIWILLFGLATEAATYVLIGVPAAYLVVLGWRDHAKPRARLASTFAYVGFVGAEIVNSWFHIKRNVHLVHAIQPCIALCFCVALYYHWKHQPMLRPHD